jgi:general L-amino acid transport system permease protein
VSGTAQIDPVPATTGATTAPVIEQRRQAAPTGGPWAWARLNLFGSWWSTAVTLGLGALIVLWGIRLVEWAVVNAVWSVPYNASGQPQTAACQEARGVGACWAIITDKYRLILFGRYPYEEQWRPAICIALFIGLYVISAIRRFWRRELVLVWLITLAAIGVLMWGGVLGLSFVPQDSWGGLPITLILATFGLAFSFPLSILVALGRRSTKLPAVKLLCILYVELIRGVPLISLLFMASVMFPLFMPEGVNIDKLLRAQIAIILFAAAYLAEVIRGGLQAIPKGQIEAADSLGLGYWRRTRLIVLPQALSLVIPPLVNNFIGAFKNTSLVIIIGLFDLLGTANAALADPNWQGFAPEAYIFTAAIYFCFCFFMSRYSQMLEREFSQGRQR